MLPKLTLFSSCCLTHCHLINLDLTFSHFQSLFLKFTVELNTLTTKENIKNISYINFFSLLSKRLINAPPQL